MIRAIERSSFAPSKLLSQELHDSRIELAVKTCPASIATRA
ncbi:hypothetical protein [Bradyrhizobium sp. 21]|nr:hypothetical protein [Bradyrhizobium sp. 21]